MTTVLELYNQMVSRLSSAGLPDPDTESVIILRHLLQCRRADIFLHGGKTVDLPVTTASDQIVERRLAREPLAYILGDQEFYGRSFVVTPAVLIPRQETELLVERALSALERVGNDQAQGWAVDLGTGSGIIAITLALECPKINVVAVDLSFSALTVARHNSFLYGVADRIHFVNSDWASALSPRFQYDLIVSNPPYVARKVQGNLQAELASEPEMALFGGVDGTEEITRIAQGVTSRLRPGGVLLMEIGYDQQSFAVSVMHKTCVFDEIVVYRDLAGHPRLLSAHAKY